MERSTLRSKRMPLSSDSDWALAIWDRWFTVTHMQDTVKDLIEVGGGSRENAAPHGTYGTPHVYYGTPHGTYGASIADNDHMARFPTKTM